MTIHQVILYFLVYSFLGWIYETIFVSLREREWSNRGFLMGPICPIYGVGAIAAVLICSDISIPMTFILCMLGSAVMEYTTAYVLDKLFHASWWDYSNMPFNVNGYICLPASLLFGAAGVLISKIIHPVISVPIAYIPETAQEAVAFLLVAICSADLTLTVSSLSDFAVRIKEFESKVNNAISNKYDELENTVSDKLATVKRHTMLTDKTRESIIEREIKKADLRLSRIQMNALQGIRRFKKEELYAGNIGKIHAMLLKISSKRKK